jgi:hypothetical protein
LVKSQKYNSTVGSWDWGYECQHSPPKKYVALINYDRYWGYEARYGDNKEKLQAEQRAEAEAYLQKNPACDCEIYVPGRQAEIVDFGCVLDLLIRTDPAIKYHLLEKNSNIHKRGFEILHSSDMLDVVRHRDQHGVAVWLYWKCKWEPDHNLPSLNWKAMSHEAAAYITHRDTSLRAIFSHTARYPIWTKPDRVNERAHCLRAVPFWGPLGKRKKAEIIKWVKELEAKLAAYQEQAAAAVKEWTDWGRQLKESVAAETKVYIRDYNGKSKTANITISGALTQAQIERIAVALKEPELSA